VDRCQWQATQGRLPIGELHCRSGLGRAVDTDIDTPADGSRMMRSYDDHRAARPVRDRCAHGAEQSATCGSAAAGAYDEHRGARGEPDEGLSWLLGDHLGVHLQVWVPMGRLVDRADHHVDVFGGSPAERCSADSVDDQEWTVLESGLVRRPIDGAFT